MFGRSSFIDDATQRQVALVGDGGEHVRDVSALDARFQYSLIPALRDVLVGQ